MKVFWALLGMLVVGACAMKPALAQEWAPAAMNTVIDDTNFLVNRGCSGTLIDSGGFFILTAQHCVNDQYETIEREKISDDGVIKKEKVRRLRDGTVTRLDFRASENVGSTTYKVQLVAGDKDKDLALLKVKGLTWGGPSARFACKDVVRGDTVYAVGNPHGILYSSVTKGIVSSIQRDYGIIGIDENAREPLVQFSSGIIGGNSGGALYNGTGELVGVPVRGSQMNEILGFAVPLAVIRGFLTAHNLGRLFDHCAPAP